MWQPEIGPEWVELQHFPDDVKRLLTAPTASKSRGRKNGQPHGRKLSEEEVEAEKGGTFSNHAQHARGTAGKGKAGWQGRAGPARQQGTASSGSRFNSGGSATRRNNHANGTSSSNAREAAVKPSQTSPYGRSAVASSVAAAAAARGPGAPARGSNGARRSGGSSGRRSGSGRRKGPGASHPHAHNHHHSGGSKGPGGRAKSKSKTKGRGKGKMRFGVSVGAGWWEKKTADGVPYYWHESTGELTWEKPKEIMSQAEREMDRVRALCALRVFLICASSITLALPYPFCPLNAHQRLSVCQSLTIPE